VISARGNGSTNTRSRIQIRRFAAIANLKPALSLAFGDDLAVLQAQFDLSNVTASSIDLLRD
jgi:hypothetical protein